MAAVINPETVSGIVSSVADTDDQRFAYSALDPLGRDLTGFLYARDATEATRLLTGAQLAEIEIWPAPPKMSWGKRVSRQKRGHFAQQYAQRLRAGQQPKYALQQMARAETHPLLRGALKDVLRALDDKQETVANAFRQRPDAFEEAFCKVVETAELNGDPAPLITKYGDRQLKTARHIAQITGSLIYPAVVLAVAGGIILFMCFYLLPQMEEMYRGLLESANAQLPWPTRLLLGAVHFVFSGPGVLLVLLVSGATVWVARWLLYTRGGQEWYERHALRLPVLGPSLKTFHAAYSVHLLALLCEILLPKVAVAELAHASLNAVFRERLEGVHQAMDDKAVKMSAAFLPHADLFGHDFQPTLATAEETRDFSGLERLGQVLDEELETQLTKFSKLMEPLTIICAGAGIFLVLIAMYLPLITLIGRLANRH